MKVELGGTIAIANESISIVGEIPNLVNTRWRLITSKTPQTIDNGATFGDGRDSSGLHR